MPTKNTVRTRASDDRLVDLHDGGQRLGYAPESLRQMMHRGDDPPPYRKINGRWRAWLSDLDAWAERRLG